MYSRRAPRRRHGAEFKAKVLAECDEPGASISGVALAHGLNANLVRQWRAGRGVKVDGAAVARSGARKAPKPTEGAAPLIGAPEFLAVEMPAPVRTTPSAPTTPAGRTLSPTVEPLIHIELRRGPLHLNVRWPTSAGDDCRAWLSELCSGLLK
jgi:transposase